jgi:hypothetical protein
MGKITWLDDTVLASGLTLAAQATDHYIVDMAGKGADVVILSLSPTFGGSPDESTDMTIRGGVSAAHCDTIGTVETMLQVAQSTSATKTDSTLLTGKYPVYKVEIMNDDTTDDITYTLQARYGFYMGAQKTIYGEPMSELAARVRAAQA